MIRFLLLLFLISCTPASKTTGFAGIVMTIPYRIIIGEPLSFTQKRKVKALIEETFSETNHIYNYWNPQSEMSRLNQLKAHIKVPISPQLEKLLKITHQIVHLTEGRFDPTIRPLQLLWKEKLEQGILPTSSEIATLKPAIGWDKIHMENHLFWKDHDLTSLDLGGIAKGYTVDLLTERLNEAGYPNLYVEWGGENRATGIHPDNRSWTIFISNKNDLDPASAHALVPLNNQAIATSGNYQQFWRVNNTTYTHILNPKTLSPLTSCPTSVSILAPTCTLADAIATAVMIDPGPWLNTLPIQHYWIID